MTGAHRDLHRPPSRLQEFGEESAQLRDPHLDITGGGGDRRGPVPVTQRVARRVCSPGSAQVRAVSSWSPSARTPAKREAHAASVSPHARLSTRHGRLVAGHRATPPRSTSCFEVFPFSEGSHDGRPNPHGLKRRSYATRRDAILPAFLACVLSRDVCLVAPRATRSAGG